MRNLVTAFIHLVALFFAVTAAPALGGVKPPPLPPPMECARQVKALKGGGWAENVVHSIRSKYEMVDGKEVVATYLFPNDGKGLPARVQTESHKCQFPNDAPSLETELANTLTELAAITRQRLDGPPQRGLAGLIQSSYYDDAYYLDQALAACSKVDTAEMRNAVAAAKRTLHPESTEAGLTTSAARAPSGGTSPQNIQVTH